MYNPFPLPPEEIASRGIALYRSAIEPVVHTAENTGKYLSIAVLSGGYSLGNHYRESVAQVRADHPNPAIYTLRIGYAAAVSMSGRTEPVPI